jgi:hypothetical protein
MNSAASFSADYNEARAKFREEAQGAGGVLEAMKHPEQGPNREELFIDVALFGPPEADKILVMQSGTHGVEGFCGSGAQVDLLRRGGVTKLPPDTAILMVHAINPHGFAWLRRVTHENVDLNRNWVDFGKPLPSNPGYDELQDAICPTEWTEEVRLVADAKLEAYSEREGSEALRQAMWGGQYICPNGIFYGGLEPTWSRLNLASVYARYLARASRVAIIDYHTGLGPWGFGEHLVAVASTTDVFRRLCRWYGLAVVSAVDGTSSSTKVAGDGLSAAPQLLAGAEVTGMALEVGTLDPGRVRTALRADAWLHAHGDPFSPLGQEIKKEIRAAFYGDADDWKGMVAAQSLLVCKQALLGLQHPRSDTREASWDEISDL